VVGAGSRRRIPLPLQSKVIRSEGVRGRLARPVRYGAELGLSLTGATSLRLAFLVPLPEAGSPTSDATRECAACSLVVKEEGGLKFALGVLGTGDRLVNP
jgi:hypothetical protein